MWYTQVNFTCITSRWYAQVNLTCIHFIIYPMCAVKNLGESRCTCRDIEEEGMVWKAFIQIHAATGPCYGVVYCRCDQIRSNVQGIAGGTQGRVAQRGTTLDGSPFLPAGRWDNQQRRAREFHGGVYHFRVGVVREESVSQGTGSNRHRKVPVHLHVEKPTCDLQVNRVGSLTR